MSTYPGAQQRLLPPGCNHSRGGMGAIHGVVIHVIVGSLSAADGAFHNPTWRASAHFGVGKSGLIYQWVDTSDKAWAEGAGNPNWISVETEGQPTEFLTDAQLESCARIVRWARDAHGFPLQVIDDPNGYGVGTHQMGGQAWGGHSCPGSLRAGQRAEIVRRAAGGAPKPPPAPKPPEEEDMPVFVYTPGDPNWYLTSGFRTRPVRKGENQLLVDLHLVEPGPDGKPFAKPISRADLDALIALGS